MPDTAFIRTDLALEAKEGVNIEGKRGIYYRETEIDGIAVQDMHITSEEGAGIIGKPIGRYITVECGRAWLLDDDTKERVSAVIADRILNLLPKGNKTLLCVGLGNRDITADALGPLTVDQLTVTRHVKEYDRGLFDRIGQEEVAAIAPGVVGQTGIETLELIRGAVEKVKPDCVIAVDALAARSVERLATTVQISDSGIAPGSGIGNRRKEISQTTLGVPVIAVGVPTVVDSSTLVYDALSKAGIENIEPSLERVLENGRSFFVSLKESDIAVGESAALLSSAMNRAFCRR